VWKWPVVKGKHIEMKPRMSNFYLSASGREKKTNKTIYNKHQNAIDMQDYQAVILCVAYKINCKFMYYLCLTWVVNANSLKTKHRSYYRNMFLAATLVG